MKNKILVMLLMLTSFLFAQVDRTKAPEAGPAPEVKIADYQSFQLENGLKVYVIENHKLPRIDIRLVFKTDPVLEKENVGYISAMGNLLRRGTKNRPKDQLDEEIDFIGAYINTSSNFCSAGGLSKYTDKIMNLFSDVILNPDFKNEELDKIKKQELSGLKMAQTDPNSIMKSVSEALIYGKNHPYGEIKTEESVNSITIEMCQKYYDEYFRPNVAHMAIVGDISVDKAKELVEKYFAKWQKKEVPTFKYKLPRKPLVRKVAIIDNPTGVQSVVKIAYPIKLKLSDKDYFPLKILNHAFGGSATARLFMNLREDKAYTYGAYSTFSPDELIGDFSAWCQVRNAVTDSSITEIIKEMKKVREDGITTEEIEAAKKYIIGSFARSLESPQTIASFALNIAIYNLPKDYYKNYLKAVNSVTSTDIKKIARKYFTPNKAWVIVVGKADEVADKMKQFSPSGKIHYYDFKGNEYDPSLKALPSDVTIESIMNKYIKVLGGVEKIKNIKDKTVVMEGEIQGQKMIIETIQKAPNKIATNITAGPMVIKSVFDGEKGTVSMMGQEKPIEGAQLEQMKIQADMYAQLKWKNNIDKYKLLGTEKVNGKDTYKVSYAPTEKILTVMFYDVETGLLLKTVTSVSTPQGPQNTTVEIKEYMDVDGYKIPAKISNQNGMMNFELTTTKAEINKGVDDSIFK